MREQRFRVEEIHCEGCEHAIRNSLGRLDGVSVVEPDQATDEVTVGDDESAIEPEAIVERLADAGFPPAE